MKTAVNVAWLEGETEQKNMTIEKYWWKKDWQRKDSQAETASLGTRPRNYKLLWIVAWYTETWPTMRYHWQAQKLL